MRLPLFDLAFGIVLPIGCILAGVFWMGGVFREGIFGGTIGWLAYAGIALEIAVLSLWLAFGNEHPHWGRLAGCFLSLGAAGWFGLGTALLILLLSRISFALVEYAGNGLMLFVSLASIVSARVYYRRGFDAVRSWSDASARGPKP